MTIELPPLPERKRRSVTTHGWGAISVNIFTVEQMRSYALEAVLAERERLLRVMEENQTFPVSDVIHLIRNQPKE